MSVPDILLPSPPNTSHREYRVSGHFFQLAKPATSTPDDSPASLLPSSGNASRKRVEFSPWTNILDPPSLAPALDASALKTIPRSKDCQTGVKSILKSQTEQRAFSSAGDTILKQSSNTMDSLVQSLAVNDKITSTDAYQSLTQLIKTYDELPDDSDTRGNVASISRSIKRDLATQEQGLTTPVDINLVTQALKVTVILVWSEQFSPLVPDDFKIFITDRAIAVLAEHTLPKIVIVHYMHVLAMQSFKTALFMSGTRTVKLLEALREITSHVQGKGVIAERLLIYQKMIEQAKPIMKARANYWIREMLTSLVSNVKDIRDKAISVCSRAVAAFPASSVVSQAARDVLTEDPKEKTLSAILSQRLERMISVKDEALQVPQIWSLVMLLCNSIEARLDTWSHIREWLRVIQRCFNCSDIGVRIQAFPAWNRFIYIVKPHQASEAMMSMLAKPIAAQIERTGANASSKGSRPPAVSSYCTLLYYAFRPAATHKQYTRSWNEYVVKMITSEFLSKSSANADLCCRVLMALFWKDNNVSRIWNENRAHDNKLTEPEEIPAIDCKWVRAKAGPILDIFRLLFQYSAWGPSIQHSDQAFVAKAWRSFLRAIKESACKEIKPSIETKKAIAACLNFLQDIEVSEQTMASDDTSQQTRTKLACRILITELGSVAILNACEAREKQRYPDSVVVEILFDALNKIETVNGVQSVQAPGITDGRSGRLLTPELNRGFGLLGDRMELAYHLAKDSHQTLVAILDSCSTILSKVVKFSTPSCLKSLQHSLAMVMKDDLGICKDGKEYAKVLSTWKRISSSIVRKLSEIPLDVYVELDELIAATLSSTNAFTVNELLTMWNGKTFVGESAEYGPLLTAAIENLRHKVDINLPGVSQMAVDGAAQSQILRVVFEEGESPRVPISTAGSLELQALEIQNHGDFPPNFAQPEVDQRRIQIPEQSHKLSRQKPLHNDSQINFLHIESSPTNIDEADSQMLTERQNDTRKRQRAERGITFPDLRSSPHNKTSLSGRATSADCEMARKIAASENLPTTPTLVRHATAVDDEALPSPTPKARKHASNLAEIDIPSSPPSAIANRDADIVFQCMDTLPSKVVDLHEVNMVYFDKVQQIERHDSPRIGVVAEGAPNLAVENATVTKAKQMTPDLISSDARDPEAEAMLIDNIDTVTDHSAKEHFEQESTLDSDEDPSASQLSQDLDWHVMGETRSSLKTTSDAVDSSKVGRKRKRKDVNYAALADRQSRKRASTGTTTKMRNDPPLPPVAGHLVRDNTQPLAPSVNSRCIDLAVTELFNPPTAAGDASQSDISHPTSSPAGIRGAGEKPRRSQRFANITKAPQGEVDEKEQSGNDIPQVQNSESVSAQQIKESFEIGTDHPDPNTQNQESIQGNTTGSTDIMSALQMALDGLKNGNKANLIGIDLKAIDDMCFLIRFQAQELLRTRMQ